jgi:hypothetical protein
MFTRDDMLRLTGEQPFIPFRIHLSDGRSVDVLSPDAVSPGRRWAFIWNVDPNDPEASFDSYSTVYYIHITGHEPIPTTTGNGQAGP